VKRGGRGGLVAVTRNYMGGGANAPLIRIGDLRSRRSKGGQQFTDH
jgi:hypothetical protein